MYKDILDPYGLTYTQYITMITLWENDHQTVSDLGNHLSLDSGTLTPLLKKLEKDGRIIRNRDQNDERKVIVSLTEEGKKLSIDAEKIPYELIKCVDMSESDTYDLFNLLTKLHKQNKTCRMTGNKDE